ncbi:ABC transporter [Rhizobiales bacterium GAS191]|nr:ABC transporter [Rhizobiales bacterium GAS191]
MSSINLRQVSVFAPNPLFQDLSLTIGDNERLGLIAGNGAGKSTLLRCLAGRVAARVRGGKFRQVASLRPRLFDDRPMPQFGEIVRSC